MNELITQSTQGVLILPRDPSWISTKQEIDLPPLRQTVLVYGNNRATTADNYITVGSLISVDDNDQQFWLIMVYKNDTVFMVRGYVSHWMHLPQAPK